MEEKSGKSIPKVFILPRKLGKQIVNTSPFCVKLETWLRLNKIEYEVEETMLKSEKTQTLPYIHLNGIEHTDTNLIIHLLTRRYDLDPSEGLSTEEQAVSRAFQKMMDENTYWAYSYYRHIYKPHEYDRYFHLDHIWPVRKVATRLLQKDVRKRAEAQGMGKLSIEEIVDIGQADMKSVGKYLGEKNYMFGDSPTLADCVIFAHLSQVAYLDFVNPFKEVFVEYPNLRTYLDRVKVACWPDWDDLVDMSTFD